MTTLTITAEQIMDMVSHWLNTPVNGYFGSTYGAPVEELIQQPMGLGLADAFITKMKTDLPILSVLGDDQISVYFQDITTRFDAKKLVVQVGNVSVTVDELRNIS